MLCNFRCRLFTNKKTLHATGSLVDISGKYIYIHNIWYGLQDRTGLGWQEKFWQSRIIQLHNH